MYAVVRDYFLETTTDFFLTDRFFRSFRIPGDRVKIETRKISPSSSSNCFLAIRKRFETRQQLFLSLFSSVAVSSSSNDYHSRLLEIYRFYSIVIFSRNSVTSLILNLLPLLKEGNYGGESFRLYLQLVIRNHPARPNARQMICSRVAVLMVQFPTPSYVPPVLHFLSLSLFPLAFSFQQIAFFSLFSRDVSS